MSIVMKTGKFSLISGGVSHVKDEHDTFLPLPVIDAIVAYRKAS